MTWVIGMTGFLSRGILVADTRITVRYGNGQPDRELDGVLKVHAVAGNIAIGFAGNIDTAFRVINDARRDITLSVPPGTMFAEPTRWLLHWRRRVSYAWNERITDAEREGGLHLYYMAARLPVHPILMPVEGWILRSPDFELERVPPRVARSIGSGAHVAEFVEELERVSEEYPNLIGFELGPWQEAGGVGLPLAMVIGDAIERVSPPGISPHLVLCGVRWGQIDHSTNEREGLTDPSMTRRTPPIARDIVEWRAFKQRHGLAGTVAVAEVS